MEVEIPLGDLDKTIVESIDGDAEVAEDMFGTLSFKEEVSKSRDFPETDIPVEEKELEESYVEQESVESISSPQVNIWFVILVCSS